MGIDVRATLERLINERKANNRLPESVLYTELCNDIMHQVRQELNNLFSDKIIDVQATLNDKSITLL